MNKQPRIPDPETSKRLLANLRRTRLEVQEVNLELGEINAMLAETASPAKIESSQASAR
ncbi:MAG: hypothetical protein ACM65M_03605 [Microcoleus sp.]